MSTTDIVYYELGWSILSTIGIANFLFGLVIVGITTFSNVAAVPVITSAACALANALCYYSFYRPDVPPVNRAVGSVFADLFWLVRCLLVEYAPRRCQFDFTSLDFALRPSLFPPFFPLFFSLGNKCPLPTTKTGNSYGSSNISSVGTNRRDLD
jgi:hypothetical protein